MDAYSSYTQPAKLLNILTPAGLHFKRIFCVAVIIGRAMLRTVEKRGRQTNIPAVQN
jgi:RPA family protein